MKIKQCLTKISAVLCAAVCIFFSVCVSAEDYPPDVTVFAGGHVTGFAGEQVAFPVDLPQKTGFRAFGLALEFDAALTPVMKSGSTVSYKKGEAAEDVLLLVRYIGDGNIIGTSGITPDLTTASGNFFTVQFEIPKDAEPDTVYSVKLVLDLCSLVNSDSSSAKNDTVKCITLDGSITVADPNRKGDLNRDGKISVADAVLLNR